MKCLCLSNTFKHEVGCKARLFFTALSVLPQSPLSYLLLV